ncbi:hypothetical protein [Chitinimonas naiadis]
MNLSEYLMVGEFRNDSQTDMRLFLEMSCEEVILSPGHHVELFAMLSTDLQPITIAPVADGWHVFPHKVFDPDWHIRFNGQLIKAGFPTRLADFNPPGDHATQ